MKSLSYFLGLDCGTDSVGYAVTDLQYTPETHKGEPMLGVTTFEQAGLSDVRRKNRTARRRLDRRQQRVQLVQELFAPYIANVDPQFFVRLRQSALWREDWIDPKSTGVLFCDEILTDKDYHQKYPTIHHLICDLLYNPEQHDIRLIYIASAWLVAHRGHFLSSINIDNVNDVMDISNIYNEFLAFFDAEKPWNCDAMSFGDVLRRKMRIRDKEKLFYDLLFEGKKPGDLIKDSDDPQAPVYSRSAIIKLLCGATIAPKDVFLHKHEEYNEVESVSLDSGDEKFTLVLSQLGDDAELLLRLKALFDWAVLADVLRGEMRISDAKVRIYEEHKNDLKNLKSFIRKYLPDQYASVFCNIQEGNYAAYVDHWSSTRNRPNKRASKDSFSSFLRKILKDTVVEEVDRPFYEDALARLEMNTFLPKQTDSDNRVIPHQLYAVELIGILRNAAAYLPFLQIVDSDGLTLSDKLLSVFLFRIPYYVGPLNKNSSFAWLERKSDKIYPWNFEKIVDLDKSEDAFIRRMTNTCTYLPGEYVVPQNALCYARFTVLNEINPLKINGCPITPSQKQAIFHALFEIRSRVTVKALRRFCEAEGFLRATDTLSGIDTEGIKSSLHSQIAFSKLLSTGMLAEEQVEQIIERITCTTEQPRLRRWLDEKFPQISTEDRQYISRLKFSDFGRLSNRFLCEIEGMNKETGEMSTILNTMWNTNDTLMQLLSERYTFSDVVREHADAYYRENPMSLAERMDQMYLSNTVKRSIYRTLDIVKDVVKVMGVPPKKIFVEMARGTTEDQKGKRTKTRKSQISDLYKHCAEEEVRELNALLETKDDNSLQSEKLYLYFMQLGKCMYSGSPIDLDRLSDDKFYDVDHIYPQSKVKDDSVLNNKVLVLSKLNAEKADNYPIKTEIRQSMTGYWTTLHKAGLITDEKYRRLTRPTSFTDDEKMGFINRQLVETRQSTKAIATLLEERYPNTEIVYVKAGLVSEFRQQYDLLKSRTINDLHHAKDAYLNIVVGNVYHERFNKQFFRIDQEYSMNTKQLFERPIWSKSTCVWNGQEDIDRIKQIVQKNHVRITRYAFCRKGELFDQQPLRAEPNSSLLPRKVDLPADKYGGYRKLTASFFVLLKYRIGKKSDIMMTPIDLMSSSAFLNDPIEALTLAKYAAENVIGKPIDAVELPMGRRVLKINTIFSADGFRFALAGKSNAGKVLLISPLIPLHLNPQEERYIKRLESFVNRKSRNTAIKLQPDYDKITAEQSIALYDSLTHKLTVWPFSKRPPLGIGDQLVEGREKFVSLNLEEQAKVLNQTLSLFGRSGQGSDLVLIGGVAKAGVPTLSSNISNWMKYYKDVRIIDQSASGLFEKQSVNLLTLL